MIIGRANTIVNPPAATLPLGDSNALPRASSARCNLPGPSEAAGGGVVGVDGTNLSAGSARNTAGGGEAAIGGGGGVTGVGTRDAARAACASCICAGVGLSAPLLKASAFLTMFLFPGSLGSWNLFVAVSYSKPPPTAMRPGRGDCC